MLILDGHGSHATPEFDLFCSENNIITDCLPPHTSHILQPLDVACLGLLKTAYGHLVQDVTAEIYRSMDSTNQYSIRREYQTKEKRRKIKEYTQGK